MPPALASDVVRERVVHVDSVEPAVVAIAGPDRPHPVLAHQRRNVRIWDQVAACVRIGGQLPEPFPEPLLLAGRHDVRHQEQRLDVGSGHVRGEGTLEDRDTKDTSGTPRMWNMTTSDASQDRSVSDLISTTISDLGDWRGETLSRMRTLIKEADPDVVEEWKWKKPSSPGVPVWSHQGMICTGETYKNVVKLTFFKGASLEDPARLFNSSLDGNARRAIDIHEGEEVDGSAFKALIREAVALNTSGKAKPRK